MSSVLAPAMAAALLLALAGAQKLLDPTMTVGALQELRLPGSAALVRVGAAVELAVGVLAVVVGGPFWWLVVASYVLFTGFVGLALGRRSPIGTCGCFGRADTAPSSTHLWINAVLALWAAAAAVLIDESPSDDLALHPAGGAFVYGASVAIAAVLYAAYTRRRVGVVEPAPEVESATR